MPSGIYDRSKGNKGWFKKGCKPKHKFPKGYHPPTEWKKGQSSWAKLHPELMPRGKDNSQWKGGKIISTQGYVFIHQPSHPRANKHGYVKRANLVMEKMIGRFLTSKEIVHHKGTKYPMGSIKDKQDDRPRNLMLFKNQSEHFKFHLSFRKRSKFGQFT